MTAAAAREDALVRRLVHQYKPLPSPYYALYAEPRISRALVRPPQDPTLFFIGLAAFLAPDTPAPAGTYMATPLIAADTARLLYGGIHVYRLRSPGLAIDGVISLAADAAAAALERVPDHPLDWTQWPADWMAKVPTGVRLRRNVADLNADFRFSRFVAEHPLQSRRQSLWATLLAKERAAAGPSALVVGTYNVLQFQSMRADDTVNVAIDAVVWLFHTMSIDVLVLQEVMALYARALMSRCAEAGITVAAYDPYSEIAVLVRDPAHLSSMSLCMRYMVQAPHQMRSYYTWTYHGITMAGTHLEIGRRYTDYDGGLLDTPTIAKRARSNTEIRAGQLRELIGSGADVVMGDFNMETWTPEFAVLAEAYDIPDRAAGPTTPYDSRVDFIGYRKQNTRVSCRRACILDSPYSDHLPVVHVIAQQRQRASDKK